MSDEEFDLSKLPQRAPSKRKRTIKTFDQESSGDEDYQGQDAQQEKEGEAEKIEEGYKFEEVPSSLEESDSDISDSEEESDLEAGARVDLELQKEEKRKARNKKQGVYIDPLLKNAPRKKFSLENKQKKRNKNFIIKSQSTSQNELLSDSQNNNDDTQLHNTFGEKDYNVKSRKHQRKRIFTQEQLLAEAKITEQKNAESLAKLLFMEKEKKKIIVHKKKLIGPYYRYFNSSRKKFCDEKLTKTVSFFGTLDEVASSFPHKKRTQLYQTQHFCCFSNKPAIYLDPKTKVPFSSVEAFKKLKKISQENDASGQKFIRNNRIFDEYSENGALKIVRIKKPLNQDPLYFRKLKARLNTKTSVKSNKKMLVPQNLNGKFKYKTTIFVFNESNEKFLDRKTKDFVIRFNSLGEKEIFFNESTVKKEKQNEIDNTLVAQAAQKILLESQSYLPLNLNKNVFPSPKIPDLIPNINISQTFNSNNNRKHDYAPQFFPDSSTSIGNFPSQLNYNMGSKIPDYLPPYSLQQTSSEQIKHSYTKDQKIQTEFQNNSNSLQQNGLPSYSTNSFKYDFINNSNVIQHPNFNRMNSDRNTCVNYPISTPQQHLQYMNSINHPTPAYKLLNNKNLINPFTTNINSRNIFNSTQINEMNTPLNNSNLSSMVKNQINLKNYASILKNNLNSLSQ